MDCFICDKCKEKINEHEFFYEFERRDNNDIAMTCGYHTEKKFCYKCFSNTHGVLFEFDHTYYFRYFGNFKGHWKPNMDYDPFHEICDCCRKKSKIFNSYLIIENKVHYYTEYTKLGTWRTKQEIIFSICDRCNKYNFIDDTFKEPFEYSFINIDEYKVNNAVVFFDNYLNRKIFHSSKKDSFFPCEDRYLNIFKDSLNGFNFSEIILSREKILSLFYNYLSVMSNLNIDPIFLYDATGAEKIFIEKLDYKFKNENHKNDNIFELNVPYKYDLNNSITDIISQYEKLTSFKDKIDFIFNIHMNSFGVDLSEDEKEFLKYVDGGKASISLLKNI